MLMPNDLILSTTDKEGASQVVSNFENAILNSNVGMEGFSIYGKDVFDIRLKACQIMNPKSFKVASKVFINDEGANENHLQLFSYIPLFLLKLKLDKGAAQLFCDRFNRRKDRTLPGIQLYSPMGTQLGSNFDQSRKGCYNYFGISFPSFAKLTSKKNYDRIQNSIIEQWEHAGNPFEIEQQYTSEGGVVLTKHR